MTVVYYLYKQGFGYFQMGYAAAVACALFLIILVITLLQWFVTQRKVFYQ
jgi:multiple sugar transport system permease protein